MRVHAAGVNPADVVLRDGSLAALCGGLEPPYLPGTDVAGVVESIGPDVDRPDLAPGTRVVGIVDNQGSVGSYAERVALPADSVVPAPDDPAAASYLMNALTARTALDLLDLPTRSTLLVTGAPGAVGAYAVRLGSSDGLLVIAVAAPSDSDYLCDRGAAAVVDRGPTAAGAVRHIVPDGVDAVLDTALLYDEILSAVRDGGRHADIRF